MPVVDTVTDEKPSWADLVEEAGEGVTTQLPQRTEKIDGDKKVVTQYKRNDDGKLLKIITTYRIETMRVTKDIALRKQWRKFGDCQKDKPGPDSSTTIVGDDVFLTLISSKENPDAPEEDALKKIANQKIVSCRICKGDHWTTKCPYKDQLEVIQQQLKEEEAGLPGTPPSEPANPPAAATAGGKYIAPGLREGATRRGETMPRSQRDETATIRVTNISEETRESDLQELLRPFGPISRIFLAKDKFTNQSKGFAFINFVHREDAARAIESLKGFGYDHLILNVEWAKPSTTQQ